MALAYIYVRWSSEMQSDGDSETRQLRDIMAWCERRGFETDPSRVLVDRGRSGFAGAHLAKGELGKFVRQVEIGTVPAGSVLVVEEFDRISRLPISQARRVIETLTKAGIRVGVVASDQVLDAKSGDDLTSAVGMLLRVHLAHEESNKKRERGRSAWAAARKAGAEDGSRMNSRGPLWLDYVDGKWQRNQHAATVRRIFDLSIAGHGNKTIATILNRDSAPRPSGSESGWTASIIQSILRSHAAYGAWLPKTCVKSLTDEMVETPVGIVTRYRVKIDTDEADIGIILNYYRDAAVVDKSTWDRAQAAVTSRAKGGGNRGALRNVLQGCIYCAACGGRMQLWSRSANDTNGRFVCNNSKLGQCDQRTMTKAEPIVAAALDRAMSLFDFLDGAVVPERSRLESEISEKAAQRDRLQARIDRLMMSDDDTALDAQVRRFSKMVEDMGTDIADLHRKLDSLKSRATRRPPGYEAMVAACKGPEGASRDAAIRTLNGALKSLGVMIRMNRPDGLVRMGIPNATATTEGMKKEPNWMTVTTIYGDVPPDMSPEEAIAALSRR